MNLNQPICDMCWWLNRTRTPVRLIDPEEETCAWCGGLTTSGIYVREHPDNVPFPTLEES